MPADRDRIRTYYAAGREADRLVSDEGWFELERTVRIVEQTVAPGSRVLDLGGGPGRLTEALARVGYQMTLLDLSPLHVQQARERVASAGLEARIEDLIVGDALELERFASAPFDAVLSFGPLYHVADEEELRRVAAATVAAVRPGGVVVGQYLPRTTAVSGLIARAASVPEQVPPGALREAWETGRYANPSTNGFCEAYFAHGAEVLAAFEQAGLRDMRLISLRGLAAPYGAALRRIRDTNPAVYEEIVALVEAIAERPDVIGMAHHAVVVGVRGAASRD